MGLTNRLILLLAGTILLAGCGYKGPLTRLDPDDQSMPKEERNALREAERREVEAGLRIPAEAYPQRVDELHLKLDERESDPFNLPPPGAKGDPIPFPGEEAPRKTLTLPGIPN